MNNNYVHIFVCRIYRMHFYETVMGGDTLILSNCYAYLFLSYAPSPSSSLVRRLTAVGGVDSFAAYMHKNARAVMYMLLLHAHTYCIASADYSFMLKKCKTSLNGWCWVVLSCVAACAAAASDLSC